MGLIGHNGGPSVEGGQAWRQHCWTAARQALLPTLPIEVLRTRVRRAQALGLEYRTYASVRAQTGHDVVGFLFSSNALRVTVQAVRMPEGRAAKLSLVQAQRVGLAQGLLNSDQLAALNPELDRVADAPALLAQYGATARHIRAVLGRVPGDRMILVGDMTLERDWCTAGRLAGYLEAGRYFGAALGR